MSDSDDTHEATPEPTTAREDKAARRAALEEVVMETGGCPDPSICPHTNRESVGNSQDSLCSRCAQSKIGRFWRCPDCGASVCASCDDVLLQERSKKRRKGTPVPPRRPCVCAARALVDVKQQPVRCQKCAQIISAALLAVCLDCGKAYCAECQLEMPTEDLAKTRYARRIV